MSHILLIEDNQANADMIIHILSSEGYEVRHFVRGLDGSRSARTEKPSLILMDFNLPDIDGRTLAMVLKKQLVDVPIVACTARTGLAEIRMAANFGCSAFLSKPFAPAELISLVKQMLKNEPSPVAKTPKPA